MKIKPHLKSFIRKREFDCNLIGQAELLDCSLGTNPFGVSQTVVEAAKEYDWPNVQLYPDPSYKGLKEEIREFWSDYADLAMEQIQIGFGAIDVLEKLNRVFIGVGSRVLGYSPQFTGYVSDIRACGGKYEAVLLNPEENFKFHIERLAEKINQEYCLIYIDNPNNPTGQVISLSDIEEVVREASNKDVAIIIDEVYGDYMEQRESAIKLTTKYNNLIVVRSFCKGIGLGSLRIGYGILSPQLSDYFNKVSPSFRATTISAYLATVALSDLDFISRSRQLIKVEKQKLIKGLLEKGYLISETYEFCPIWLVGHKNRDVDLNQHFISRGILTVAGTSFKNLEKNYARINCPAHAEDFLRRL